MSQKLATDLERTLSLDSLLELKPQDNHVDVGSFFNFLNIGPQYDIKLSPEQAQQIKHHLISMRHGTYAAVPLQCAGPDKCPIFSKCWFAQYKEDGTLDRENSTFPLLRPCPVEETLIRMKVQQYMSQFLGDLASISPTTIALITKLAELDIYEIRADIVLATGDTYGGGRDLLKRKVDTINEMTGEVYWTVEEHPMLAIKEKLQKQRDNILKQLVATPEAKLAAQAKIKESGASKDLASMLSSLNHKLAKLADNAVVLDMDEELE